MGLISSIKERLTNAINYANPLVSFQQLITSLGINQGFFDIIKVYAANKANNVAWVDGVLNLLTSQAAVYKQITYDVYRKPVYNYQKLVDQLEYIEKNIQPKTTNNNINPLTGQPYGFSSFDLETGNYYIDGIKQPNNYNLDRPEGWKPPTEDPNDPKANQNNLLIISGIGLAWWLLKKRKNKKQK